MPVREEPCAGGAPVRVDVAALTTKPVGLCPGCNAWLYLTAAGAITQHNVSVFYREGE